jgi:hypothetical protein
MLFSKHFRRREAPWEVVDTRDVSPVPMWDDDDGKMFFAVPCNATI